MSIEGSTRAAAASAAAGGTGEASHGRGLVALGDSVTRGRGGAPVLRVHPQSWAQWLAEALDLPFRNLAVDGARAADLAREQLPRLGAGYDLGALYIGVNDARSIDFDAAGFERDVTAAIAALAGSCERVLVLTIPEDLGRPRAGADVLSANEILRRAADGHVLCELRDWGGRRLVLPDAVHPTSLGMVDLAQRAALALGHTGPMPYDLAVPAPAGPRYWRWWGWQQLRDWRRQLAERRAARP